jgi:hypothetical protein
MTEDNPKSYFLAWHHLVLYTSLKKRVKDFTLIQLM